LIDSKSDLEIKDVLDIIFTKHNKEIFFDKVKVRMRKFKSKKQCLFLFKQTSNFELSDLIYLQMHYQVFFVGFCSSKLE